MPMHTPGKSDAAGLGERASKQNPLPDNIVRLPKNAGKLGQVTRNFNSSSPKPTGRNK